MSRVLVVDDDVAIAELIEYILTRDGHAVTIAETGEDAHVAVEHARPDLVILDLGLPGIGGVEVCRRLRSTTNVPILCLSGQRDEVHKVLALDVGGDDDVTKPGSMAELSARVRAQLRRAATPSPSPPGVVAVGALKLDVAAHRVTLDGAEVRLTPREVGLLRILSASLQNLATGRWYLQPRLGIGVSHGAGSGGERDESARRDEDRHRDHGSRVASSSAGRPGGVL